MFLLVAAIASSATATPAPARTTDFGVRAIASTNVSKAVAGSLATARPASLEEAVSVGARWGTVTSTRRSIARNRAVGGVRNSFHLSGRAIDIARRPGVSHASIAAAYRNAGFTLIESLDEGDHSHFAFGAPRQSMALKLPTTNSPAGTRWKMVTAPSFAAR